MYNVEYIEHTADIGIDVSGDTYTEVIRGCVLGMCDLIVKIDDVKLQITEVITLENDDHEMMLVDLLTEILFLLEVKGFVAGSATVTVEGSSVTVEMKGETLDTSRHSIGMEIKAVTYHMLEITEDPPHARVLFDV